MKLFYVFAFFALCTFTAYSAQLSPDQAQDKLRAGNLRSITNTSVRPHYGQDRRDETSTNGQQPFATVLTCSDSRIPVEHLFDQGIGDIFVVRVAGNIVGTNEAASIEYGVNHLHTPVCVVLGHTQCDAVSACVQNAPVKGNIPALLMPIQTAVQKAKSFYRDLDQKEFIERAIEVNVFESIARLVDISPMTEELVKQRKLKIVGAIYDIQNGKVTWLDSPAASLSRNTSQKTNPSENAENRASSDSLDH